MKAEAEQDRAKHDTSSFTPRTSSLDLHPSSLVSHPYILRPLLEATRNEIEAYAKAEGCACVRIYGRKGWARVLKDYQVEQIVLERQL